MTTFNHGPPSEWDGYFDGTRKRDSRVSLRTWSKGSARNDGPQRPSGVVHRRAPSSLFKEVHLCKCGQTQRRCDECGAWVCGAPGHLKHVCAVTP